MENKEFYSKSETRVKPVFGNVLIKVITSGIPVLAFVNNSVPKNVGITTEFIIAGTSDENLKIGSKVILANHSIGNGDNKILDKDNNKTYHKIKDEIDKLTPTERKELIENKTTFDAIEYLIVSKYDIKAIVE